MVNREIKDRRIFTYDFIDFPLEVQKQFFEVNHTKRTTFEKALVRAFVRTTMSPVVTRPLVITSK